MSQRYFRINGPHDHEPCPECGNVVEFRARAERHSEDCCDVWITCASCGYDPTEERPGHRMEDVWGSLERDNIAAALACSWDEPIRDGSAAPVAVEVSDAP